MPHAASRALLVLAFLSLAGSAVAASLTAGDVDDHLNWGAYLRYLDRMASGQATPSGLPALDLADRITLRLADEQGTPARLAPVTVTAADAQDAQSSGQRVVHLVSGTDGIVRLFPGFDGLGGATRLVVEAGGATTTIDTRDLGADRTVNMTVPAGSSLGPRNVDIMLVIDTTGSMSDELSYITDELRTIMDSVVKAEPDADVRVGVTVYRDVGDDYVVRDLGFAPDVSTAQRWLAQQSAGGGGDYPESMEKALKAAVHEQWRGGDTVKLLFLVADAPPHASGYDAMLDAVRDARASGVRIESLAASGAGRDAEYVMRAASALTQGRYLFLTDDSGIGNTHEVPVVPCYLVTTLDDLMVRVVRSEVGGARVEPSRDAILREVGHYDHGVCLDDVQEQQDPQQEQPTTPSPSETPAPSEPAGPGEGSSSSPMIVSDGAGSGTGMTMSEATLPASAPAPAAGPATDASGDAAPATSDAHGAPVAKVPGAPMSLALAVIVVAALAARRRR